MTVRLSHLEEAVYDPPTCPFCQHGWTLHEGTRGCSATRARGVGGLQVPCECRAPIPKKLTLVIEE